MLARRLVRISASPVVTLVGAALAIGSLTVAGDAHGDVSSWLFVGGGGSWLSEQHRAYEWKPSMQIDMGVGTSPSQPVVVGGLARLSPYFGKGSDLALAARAATQGYAVGDWGLALDAGAFKRWWGPGSAGWLASLQLGAPYGITLSVNGSCGSDENTTLGAALGIDLARLTVTRLGGQNWWHNPRPAWRPEAPTRRQR